MKKTLIIFLISLFCGSGAYAGAKFKGYSRTPNAQTEILREPLERFEESSKNFLILVKGHAAFYTFPKKESYNDQVREFLQSSLKSKKSITLEVDPTTSQIHELGSP